MTKWNYDAFTAPETADNLLIFIRGFWICGEGSICWICLCVVEASIPDANHGVLESLPIFIYPIFMTQFCRWRFFPNTFHQRFSSSRWFVSFFVPVLRDFHRNPGRCQGLRASFRPFFYLFWFHKVVPPQENVYWFIIPSTKDLRKL